MADIAPKSPEEIGYAILRKDIPEPLVDAVLDQQRQTEMFFRYKLSDWRAMQTRPNLRHFIAVTSHEVAPDDPIMREKVTIALLGLLSLLDEAVTNEKLEDIFNEIRLPRPDIQADQADTAA